MQQTRSMNPGTNDRKLQVPKTYQRNDQINSALFIFAEFVQNSHELTQVVGTLPPGYTRSLYRLSHVSCCEPAKHPKINEIQMKPTAFGHDYASRSLPARSAMTNELIVFAKLF